LGGIDKFLFLGIVLAFKKTCLVSFHLRRTELGDGFRSFRHSVLGEFTREHETDRGLDLAAAESRLLVVSGELSGFRGDALENVINETVHNGHSLLGDTSVGVNLLEHLVDVRRVRLHTLLRLGGRSSLLGCLGRLLGGCLGHDCGVVVCLLLRDRENRFCGRIVRWETKRAFVAVVLECVECYRGFEAGT